MQEVARGWKKTKQLKKELRYKQVTIKKVNETIRKSRENLNFIKLMRQVLVSNART